MSLRSVEWRDPTAWAAINKIEVINMNQIYVYYIKNNEYNCNRARQANYLIKHGVTPIRSYIDQYNRAHWIFVGTECVDLLNQYTKEYYDPSRSTYYTTYILSSDLSIS